VKIGSGAHDFPERKQSVMPTERPLLIHWTHSCPGLDLTLKVGCCEGHGLSVVDKIVTRDVSYVVARID